MPGMIQRGSAMLPRRVIIVGAAGRDFHNFNVVYRNDPSATVVAFTAAQIPEIEGRTYPAALAGPRYPRGIPIHAEEELEELIARSDATEVVFAYSDLSHEEVMHIASRALAAGADFRLLGPRSTCLRAQKPVVAVCAVRTGCGKSQTSRKVAGILRASGLGVAVVRHPMPYGDLAAQRCQRFASPADLDREHCTIEEREEYEPHIAAGGVVYAGIDYLEILTAAEQDADVILWDGGNNDLPFYTPDIHIVVADPLRPGHEERYHPGEANARAAHVFVLNKLDSARPGDAQTTLANLKRLNPGAQIILADSPVTLEPGADLRGKRVLAIEDGPTTTHGGMTFGAGVVAARAAGASAIVDPRRFAVGSIAETFAHYSATGPVLPAMGYSEHQIADLSETLRRAADAVDAYVIGTPIDLRRLVQFPKPAWRVSYELRERGEPNLATVLGPLIAKLRG